MSGKDRSRKTKLDILNQTRDRTPMPRPAVFRDKKKYDRNAAKAEGRKEQGEEEDGDGAWPAGTEDIVSDADPDGADG